MLVVSLGCMHKVSKKDETSDNLIAFLTFIK